MNTKEGISCYRSAFVSVWWVGWVCAMLCVVVCACSEHLKRLITLFTPQETDRSSFGLKVPVCFNWTLDYVACSDSLLKPPAQMKQSFIYTQNKGTAWPCFLAQCSHLHSFHYAYPPSQCLTKLCKERFKERLERFSHFSNAALYPAVNIIKQIFAMKIRTIMVWIA